MSTYALRLMRPADRDAVRAICVETCWRGGYDPAAIPSPWFWAEYWTRYFTDREPEHTWIAVQSDGDTGRDGAAGTFVTAGADGARTGDDCVVGYLTGTTDVARFDRYATRRLPALAWGLLCRRVRGGQRVCRPALRGLIWAALCGEGHLPRDLHRRYPATWHFNVRPEARGQGIGKTLVATFFARLQALGVPGVHVQNLSTAEAAPYVNQSLGMTLARSEPTVAFAHLTREPLYINTWVRELGAP